MKILGVIPLKKALLKGDLTYFSAQDVEPGNIVTITLRGKKMLGLVVSSEDASRSKIDIKDMNFQLKKIVEVKGASIFLKEYIESIFAVSDYFVASKNNMITTLIPSVFREEYDKIARIIHADDIRPNAVGLISSAPGSPEKNIHAEKLLLQEPILDRISTYKTLIRENFAAHKSVFIVLPTENDITSFEEYLAKGIEGFTFSFHGNLQEKKVLGKFEKMMQIAHPVLMLGTAPFLSIPRNDLGLIVLEHESASGYRTIGRPHIDLRVFVEEFASRIHAKLVIGDTLLRFETIAKKDMEHYTLMRLLSFRINWDGEMRVENPRKERLHTEFKIFTEETIAEIKRMVRKKKNVFVFALRKGMATVTACRDCGEMVSCSRCAAPLVLYNVPKNENTGNEERVFVCNRCGEEQNTRISCGYCNSWNLMPLGIGTDTVIEHLEKILDKDADSQKIKIFKLDKESVKTKNGAEKIVKDFEASSGSILVGTEMTLFYLTEAVPLSVVASFDSLWSIPNYKMGEKIIQLVLSIISKTKNTFIIQTKNTEDRAILAIQNGNLLSFVREEIEDRKKLSYPPFKRFIKIKVKHLGSSYESDEVNEILKGMFREYKPLVFNGFMRERGGAHVTNALIKLDIKDWSPSEGIRGGQIEENLLLRLQTLPPSFEVFVDPEDLL